MGLLRLSHLGSVELRTDMHLSAPSEFTSAGRILVSAALGSRLYVFLVVGWCQVDCSLLCPMDNLGLLNVRCLACVMVLALTTEKVLGVILIILEDRIRNWRVCVVQLVATHVVGRPETPLELKRFLAGHVVVRSNGISGY